MLNICLESKQRIAKPKQFTRGPSQARIPNAHKITDLMLCTHKIDPSIAYSSTCSPLTPTLRTGPPAHLQPCSFPPLSLPT